jgi:hypothetical protein
MHKACVHIAYKIRGLFANKPVRAKQHRRKACKTLNKKRKKIKISQFDHFVTLLDLKTENKIQSKVSSSFLANDTVFVTRSLLPFVTRS